MNDWPRSHPVLTAILGAVVIALVAAATWWSTRPATQATNEQPPTGPAATAILVPGYGGDAGALDSVAAELRSTGATVIVLDIGNGEGDISGYSTALQQLTMESTAPVAWVGYSMGGLIARSAYTADMAGTVSSITSWGSPLHGTKSASLAQFANACPTACEQMTPGSDFLDNLPTWPRPAARWVSIYSPDDDVIRPFTSSELKLPGVVNIDLSTCSPPTTPTHSELARDPDVLALTRANVAGDPVAC